MRQSFGTRLQEKTLWGFYYAHLRQNGLWRATDRIASYLSRYLWIRRFWKLLLAVLMLLEKSLIFVALSSLCFLLLPVMLFLLITDHFLHLFQDRRTDRHLLQEKNALLLWTCSASSVLQNEPLLQRILSCASHEKEKTILVLPNCANAPRTQKIIRGKTAFWVVRPAYFYHLRKKLQKQPHVLCTIVYE